MTTAASVRPGSVRISGAPPDAKGLLTGMDVRLEIMQDSGTWMPIYGIVRATITVGPNEMVRAQDVVIELTAMDLVFSPENVVRDFMREKFCVAQDMKAGQSCFVDVAGMLVTRAD